MKKLFKILGILVAVTIVLVVAAVIVLPLVLDPNDYKTEIADAVRKHTGRELRIDGDISLTVIPRLGADLGTVVLGNAAGFDGTYFASTKRVQVGVKWLPLLQKQVEMGSIIIEGLSLNLARNADGRTNFDDLIASNSDDSPEASAAPAAALAIGGVSITDANIAWNDAVTQSQVSINNLEVKTGPVSLGKPVVLKLQFNVQASEPALSGQVSLSGEFGYDADAGVASANDLSFETTINSELVPGGNASITATGAAAFDQAKQTLTLAGFSLSIPQLQLSDTEQANVNISGDIEGNLGNGRYQSQNLVVEGAISGANVPGKNLPFKLNANVDANLVDQTLVMHEYRVTSAIANFSGNAAVTKLLNDPQFKGSLEVAAFNPREMLEKLGQTLPQTADAKVLSSLELKASFAGTTNSLALKPLSAKLDDTLLTGNFEIANFATQALRIDLVMDTLNADRYLPPGTPAANPGAGAGAAAGLPLETLRRLDVDAKLALGKLQVSGLALDNIRVSLRAKDGLIKLSPLSAGLYGGTYQCNLALDARGDQARIALDEKLSGVKVGNLSKALGIDTGDMDLSDAAGDVALKANVSGDPEKQRFKLSGASIKINVTGSALPGGKLVAAANADLVLDLPNQSVSGKALQLAVKNLKLPSGLRTTGSVAADTFKARLSAKTYSASGVDIVLKALQLNADTNSTPLRLLVSQLDTDLNKQTLTADDFKVSALGLKASGKLAIANLLGDPQLAGVLDMPALNPKQLMKIFGLPPIKTTDPKALTALAVQTTFKASRNSISLRPLSMKLDETKISGAIDIANITTFSGIHFDLKATSLNVDRYLPPQAKGQVATPGAAATALPIELLRNLDINGQLKVTKLVISNLQLTDINLTVTGKDGVVRLNPLGALLYGGSYTGDVNIDARGKAPKLNINESLERVHFGPLLKDLDMDFLTGRGGARLQATATGNNTDELKRSLNGQIALLLQDGSVKQIDIANKICGGLNLLGLANSSGSNETRFTEMTVSGNIRNGILDTRDLNAKSPLLRVGGGGSIDLVREYIDYLAVVRLVGDCQGQGGGAIGSLSGLEIPVPIKGPLLNPSVTPDLSGLAIKGIKKTLSGELGETLGIEELEGLGGIFGSGTQQQQGTNTLPTEDQPAQQQQQQKKVDPLEKLGQDLLKGLFQ